MNAEELRQARADLAAVTSAMRLFSADGERMMAYMNHGKVFPRHELPKLARAALAANPDGISTRAIAERVMAEKGLDTGDKHLRKVLCLKLVNLLRKMEQRREVQRMGRDGTSLVWRHFCER